MADKHVLRVTPTPNASLVTVQLFGLNDESLTVSVVPRVVWEGLLRPVFITGMTVNKIPFALQE